MCNRWVTFLKYSAGIIAFLTGLWTFHWSIDVSLEKHGHEVRYETFKLLERQLIAKETDGLNRPFLSLAVALQAHEDAKWGHRIHRLLAHSILTEWIFHSPFQLSWLKGETTEKQKQLKDYKKYRLLSVKRYFALAKAYLLSKENGGKSDDATIEMSIDTLVGVGIYIKEYSSGKEAVEQLLKEARETGSTTKVVKALERICAELSEECCHDRSVGGL